MYDPFCIIYEICHATIDVRNFTINNTIMFIHVDPILAFPCY